MLEYTMTIGDVLKILSVIGTGTALYWKLSKFFTLIEVEHEMLVNWYCKENEIRKSELPTRSRLA